MQQTWLVQNEENHDLIIFMLGWAASPNAICHITPAGYDVLAFYNYTDVVPLRAEDFKRYRRIYLFAWSFGIWVAEQCCQELPLYRAIALNGTPYPVDANWGMRLRVVLRSMRALAKSGAANPFASGADEGRYMPDGPYEERPAAAKVDELMFLAAQAEQHSAPHIKWDRAFIANKDEIFPPARMWDYWKTVGLGTEFDSYHYPFSNPELVLNELRDS